MGRTANLSMLANFTLLTDLLCPIEYTIFCCLAKLWAIEELSCQRQIRLGRKPLTSPMYIGTL